MPRTDKVGKKIQSPLFDIINYYGQKYINKY